MDDNIKRKRVDPDDESSPIRPAPALRNLGSGSSAGMLRSIDAA